MKPFLLAAGSLLAGLTSATVAQAQTPVFVRWPFTVSATDTAAQRSANTTVNTTVLRRLVLADNSTSVTVGSYTGNVRPYSRIFGMSFAPSAVGGNWSAANGGPGGAVKRGIYAQVSVTAPAGSAGLRADSLVLTTGFIGTSSGTTLGVTYSKSGFASDSTDATGTKGLSTAGGFANPIALPQIAAAPNTTTYRVALNGSTGVTIAAGQTLTLRMYVSCSSSGASGRYATLRNLTLKSTQAVLATRSAVATNLGFYPNPAQSQLTVPHTAAKAGAQVLVYSATGARVLAQAVQPGSLETSVGLESLTRGLYLVEYADGDSRSTARLVKD